MCSLHVCHAAPLWEDVYPASYDAYDTALAKLRVGKRQLFDFLTKVWGVGPMSADGSQTLATGTAGAE